jgi:calreticulin
MKAFTALSALVAAETYFEETFSSADYTKNWVTSTWKGPNGPAGTWTHTSGEWSSNADMAKGIATTTDFNYHSISSKIAKPFSTKGKTLVLQFSVKHEKQEGSFCGGGYIKLLGSDLDQPNFGGDAPYKIMFGPDICGYDVSRIHVIFNFQGENLLRTEDIKLNYDDKNKLTHLYTLVVNSDNSYEVFLDKNSKAKGQLHDDWKFPPKSKDDPSDSKPKDWVDEKMMDDPDDKEPSDWVKEQQIKDPEASKPEGWDDDEDGDWEAPMIDNADFKGAWKAKRIDNPAYKGEWKAKQLPNADFVEDVYPYDDVGSVGFELWTVNAGSLFDNIFVADNLDAAWAHADANWGKINEGEKEAQEAYDKANKPAEPEGGGDDADADLDDEDGADAADDEEDL